MADQIYAIEWNGEYYQSVFPSDKAEHSALHISVMDAIDYLHDEHGIQYKDIVIIPRKDRN